MKQIREWLETAGSYAAGLALYETHGKSRVVLKSLQYGETDFTRATLRRELEKLVELKIPAPVPAPAAAPSAAPPAPADEPLRRQRSAWYAERDRLHAQLELVATDAERRTMGERILEVSDSLTASYQASAPPAVPARPDLAALTDKGEMRRLLANLRPQASKLKKNPARAADLQQVLADITLLEKLLTTSL